MNNFIPSVHSDQQVNSIFELSKKPLNLKNSMDLAMQLVVHGLTEPAKEFIEKKKDEYSNHHILKYLHYLDRINRNLSTHQRHEKLNVNGELFKHLLSETATFVKNPNSRRLVIVFATAWNNFGVSFPVLDLILRKSSVSILYIKNMDEGIYCDGNANMGNSIDEIAEFLKQFTHEQGFKDITVLGFSSGGYAALYAAGAIAANAYIGFGIRTDWSHDCNIPRSPGRAYPLPEHYKNNTLTNLSNHKYISQISRATLYYGDLDKSDVAHAVNMSCLKNFHIEAVAKSTHNVILQLIYAGRFEQVLLSGMSRNR